MTDNQEESQSTSTEEQLKEESVTQEEWEEARSILFQDLDQEAAEQLSNPSRAPTIRRLNFPINRNGPQDATPMQQVAAANRKRLQQITLEKAKQIEEADRKVAEVLQCIDNAHIDDQPYSNDNTRTPFRRADGRILQSLTQKEKFSQSILKEIDVDSLNKKISSDHDLLVQKVSLLESNLCYAMKKKLEAERNYKLAEAKLAQAYKELYATTPEEDKNTEASAIEEMLSREFLKDRI